MGNINSKNFSWGSPAVGGKKTEEIKYNILVINSKNFRGKMKINALKNMDIYYEKYYGREWGGGREWPPGNNNKIIR